MTIDEAKAILADDIQPNGNLYNGGWYLDYTAGRATACLDGDFGADDLTAIAIYMKSTRK